jgi:hypothetical protein
MAQKTGKNVPLSNFAVFDALSSIKFNPQNEK